MCRCYIFEITEAQRMQMEVQRRLHQQLEIQKSCSVELRSKASTCRRSLKRRKHRLTRSSARSRAASCFTISLQLRVSLRTAQTFQRRAVYEKDSRGGGRSVGGNVVGAWA